MATASSCRRAGDKAFARRCLANTISLIGTIAQTSRCKGRPPLAIEKARKLPKTFSQVVSPNFAAILAAHHHPPAFTIVPAWDNLGSNAIMCSPPDLVPLRFGPDSFFPHLVAARRQGLKPTIVRRPGIAVDIDELADLARFMSDHSDTRTWAFLDQSRAEWDAAVSLETR